jgi:hypothetical protein
MLTSKGTTMRISSFRLLLAGIVLWGIAAMLPADDHLATLQSINDKELSNYRSWSLIPGSAAMTKGEGPHGDFITTYVNEKALKAITTGAKAMPDGAIVVKDNFTGDKSYRSTVVMKKIGGKWFFGLLKPAGKASMAGFAGDLKTCAGCHAGANRDNLFYWRTAR